MSNDYKYVKKYYRKFIAIYSHAIYCALLLIIKEIGKHIYLYLCIYIYQEKIWNILIWNIFFKNIFRTS